MKRSVTITQNGREAEVTYREGLHTIAGYQEFGAADVVAIISMGDMDEWRAHHAWALARRAEILRFVADELIRQKAPSCVAEIDESSGVILLRNAANARTGGTVRPAAAAPRSPHANKADDAAWVRRYAALRGKFGLIGLAAALVFGAGMWIKTNVLVIQPGSGVPVSRTVQTETHLATLISQLQPYTPSLHHDGSTERFTVSVFLVPLDGSAPWSVPLVRDLPPGSYTLARVIGSDGQTMWINVNGLYGVNLRTRALVGEAEVVEANPGADPNRLADTRGMDIVDGRLQIVADDRSAAWILDPATLKAAPVTPQNVSRPLSNPPLTLNMAAGVLLPSGAWLGVQSQDDLDRAYKPGRWLRPVESADDETREARRLMRGEMAAGSGDDGLMQIRAMAPVSDAEYRNASFLRADEKSEPRRVTEPDSVLMLHTSGNGYDAQSTLLVSRVEVASGNLLWTVDTGIHRFKLEQIMPGESATAFVGTRPPIPDKLSEPLIVILDHASGELQTHSLWQ